LFSAALLSLLAGTAPAGAQSRGGSSSSSSSSSQSPSSTPEFAQEKAPTLDPAGPTISLISSEPVFLMAAALNACGYDEGLQQSAPVRKQVRDEIDQAMAKSEAARSSRDALCLYIAQHRMTGGERDISQYISLALYLSPWPDFEVTDDVTDLPPDATQVVEFVPILKDFVTAVDLHGIWLTVRHIYDEEADQLHDPLSQMIVNTNLYLRMPASSYDGRRFIVILEPLLSPSAVNARIYGPDYVVVVSPVNGKIPLSDVHHTYLHYVIDPLLLARTNAIDRENPIMKEVRDAPMEFRFRSDPVALTIECLIKAIEARTMETGVPVYKIPAGIDRSQLPRYEHELEAYQQKVEDARLAAVAHDMRQGFVLTQYFFEQMIQFEKDQVSLKDIIGEMVYSMDVDQQVHRARQTQFDKEADEDVLQRSKPRQLTGLDLAEAKLAEGDTATASSIANKALAAKTDSIQSVADAARADFILARVALLTDNPEQAINDFQKTIAASKEQRLVAWSHIYLGRMLDLECKRDEAVAEYNGALAARDGQQDTRLAAERGVKSAYAVKGHSCDDASDEDAPGPGPDSSGHATRAQGGSGKVQ
jgi:tetratricopeptide (TPR) repeat protein